MKLVSVYESRVTPCTPVDFCTAMRDGLAEDMEGMEAICAEKNGLGLAAPQVGIFRRFFLVDLRSKGGRLHWIFNPEMRPLTGKAMKMREGCLSIPGETYEVQRWKSVALRFQDKAGQWNNWNACKGLLAVVVQHEMDHLDGVCIRDKGICKKSVVKEKVS